MIESVQLLTKRRSVFKTAKLPQPVWDARVSSDSPLKPGDWTVGGYGIAVASNIKLGLVICKSKTDIIVKSNYLTIILVITIYSKSGGANGTHGHVTDSSVITAVSNIGVQIYEHHFGTRFYEKPPSHTFPQVKCFDILPSSSFLCLLEHVPVRVEGGLQISPQDFAFFKNLKAQVPSIINALKNLNTRKKPNANALVVSEDEEI